LEDSIISSLSDNDATEKYSNDNERLKYYLEQKKHAQESYRFPDLKNLGIQFSNRGGKFVVAPKSDELLKDNFIIGIKPSDRIFAICPDGLHRSQILYIVLLGLKRLLGNEENVFLPHGALFGFDPFAIQGNLHTLEYKYIPPQSQNDKGVFLQTFGQEKVQRIGEVICGSPSSLNFDKNEEENVIKQRTAMREYFDTQYYRIPSNTKERSLFFVFGSAVPIVLERIMEINSQEELSKCYVYAFPFDVQAFKKPSQRSLENLYRFYASLFQPVDS